MVDRRTFLAGAGASALALAAGAPIGAATDFDPAVIIDELRAVGLRIWLCKPVGRDAGQPYYSIHPERGGFTPSHLAVMARWAEALEAEPHRAGRLEDCLAELEREMGVG
ncbi:hypothetical protein [Lichenibacterium dinghuense]|uniref:hypothetical protein n=1 Tax=Lichenibacterium dinghuense TaxID=2895977 RepID=UPI001F2B321F|nr:hypothetical protein [Lichenibacterium sp. 6Y81]